MTLIASVMRTHCHICVGQFCLQQAEYVTCSSPGRKLTTQCRPAYLPPLWKECVHPEGNLYYVWDSTFKVVTDAHLPSPEIQAKFQILTGNLTIAIQNAKVTLPESVEVFLELEGDRCLYYMVDHATRSIFWLHSTATDDLSLRPVVSQSHLSVYCILMVSMYRLLTTLRSAA